MIELNTEKALKKACAFVEGEAKKLCPVDTGELRNSISYYTEGNEGTVFTNKNYAPYVEYGTGLFAEAGNGRQDVPWSYQTADGTWHSTSGQSPQPFLRPALKNNIESIKKIIAEEILNDR